MHSDILQRTYRHYCSVKALLEIVGLLMNVEYIHNFNLPRNYAWLLLQSKRAYDENMPEAV